jgi:hypothetical protein
MAEVSPDYVKDMFDTESEPGKIKVRFYRGEGGEKEWVEVDPAIDRTRQTAGYGDTDEDGNYEIWVQILEKAYAKFKNVEHVIGGSSHEVWIDFTGNAATERWVTEDNREDIVQLVKDAFEPGNRKMVAFATHPLGDGVYVDGYGAHSFDKLASGHTYVVRGVDEEKRVFSLYNPWGSDRDDTTPSIPFDVLSTYIWKVFIQ